MITNNLADEDDFSVIEKFFSEKKEIQKLFPIRFVFFILTGFHLDEQIEQSVPCVCQKHD